MPREREARHGPINDQGLPLSSHSGCGESEGSEGSSEEGGEVAEYAGNRSLDTWIESLKNESIKLLYTSILFPMRQ